VSSPAALAAWLSAVPSGSRALLLEGPAGIGKTHLWRGLVEDATARGHRVLHAQPVQAETLLVGAALIDLCDRISDAELAALPAPQASALAAALLRRSSDAANPQAVALAFTTLIRRLAERRPLLICIDDLQWLDAQTTQVVSFAARRLPSAGVGVLLGLRTEPDVQTPDIVADLADVLDVTRWPVQSMSDAALEQMLRARFGSAVTLGVLRAALRSAGGNPLYALEVARAVIGRKAHSPVDAVPLPASLAELVGRRVRTLPEPTRIGLAAAAAMRRATLRRLRELGLADDLDAAERAGLIRIDERTVTFSHPLYAAAAYDTLAAGERMALHARLAEVVQGEEERARHLALASDEPDEAVAAALDLARDRALRRGAPEAALDAAVLALRVSPDGSPALTGRRIHLGNLLFRAGETDRARRELSLAVDGSDEPLHRARALHALARLVNDTEGPVPALPLERQALALATGDDDLTADIHMGIAVSDSEDWTVGLEHARAARTLLEHAPNPDPRRIAAALCAEVAARFYSGGGADVQSCRRAVEMQGPDVSLPVSDRALSVLFYLQMWTDDFTEARAQLQHAYQLAVDEGDEPSRCYILACQATLELRAGHWPAAERLMDACVEASRATQNAYYARSMDTQRAWLAAYRGDLAAAQQVADEDLERAVAAGNELAEMHARALRGWCALARGDAAQAAADLDRYDQLFVQSNTAEPALRVVGADYIEALALAGRIDAAGRALAALTAPATRLGRVSVLAAAARAEAILHAEQGDAVAAIAAAERSVARYETLERPFDLARSRLTKGRIHRRFKQKSLARRELGAARDAFTALGAHGFAEQARAELARVGLRPPAASQLTETERRIAELAAKGHTSAEIGKTLFLSTKTVSANLTRIYRKLDVRNRAELSALLSARIEA
jgi:DNA-binding CsgD family transcriptional regulator